MENIPEIVQQAIALSQQGRPVLLVLSAIQDCGDSQAFAKTLMPVQQSFGEGLAVTVIQGSHMNRQSNPAALTDALDYFSYDKVPGDDGPGRRGHFPAGAIYKDGHEVLRLPSDLRLATINPQAMADLIGKATGLAYDKKILLARVAVVPGGVDT